MFKFNSIRSEQNINFILVLNEEEKKASDSILEEIAETKLDIDETK